LRVQQILVNEEADDQGHYQDIFNDSQSAFDAEKAAEVFEKAAYLNSESQWVVPIYLSQRIPAEQASTMQGQIVPVMVDRLSPLAPIVAMMRGRSARKAIKAATAKKEVKKPAVKLTENTAPSELESKDLEQFTYVSELKSLHIRRGFVNMTPDHWPFFAINARTQSRPVVVITESLRDEESSVWRLQPHNLARLVLSSRAQRWLEENFVPGERVQITATKESASEIQINLEFAG
jgi:hypothetical protein